MRRLADLQERDAVPSLRARMDFVTAASKAGVALDAIEMAVGKLTEATRGLLQAAEGTPHKRAAFVFANLADNFSGNLGEMFELLEPMLERPATERP